MWPHFVNLLSRSHQRMLTDLSMSDLSIIAFNILAPAAGFMALMTYKYFMGRAKGLKMRDHFKKSIIPTLIVAGIQVFIWGCVFGRSIIITTYDAHQTLVKANATLTSENKSLRAATDNLTVKITELENKPPRTIVKTNPAPQEPHNCWKYNYKVPSDPQVAGAHSATEVIIFCNYKIDTPFSIITEFDGEIITGDIRIAGADIEEFRVGEPAPRVFAARYSHPPLLPFQIIRVVVQSSKYVSVTRFGLGPAS